MMATKSLVRILNVLKKWVSRLARRCASLFFLFVSLLRRFQVAAGHTKVRDRRSFTRNCSSSSALPLSQGDTAGEDVPICFSRLPTGQMEQEVTGERPYLSDDPYRRTHSRHSQPLHTVTAMPSSETNTIMNPHLVAAESGGFHPGSMSGPQLPLQGDSSVDNRTFLRDPLQERSSPGPSHLSGHELSNSHSQPQGYTDDSHAVTATHMGPTVPDLIYSRCASSSRVSVNTGRSLTRSIVGSESRQAAYRTHRGPVHSRPVGVRNYTAVVQYGSPDMVSAPLDLPVQALPVSNTSVNHLVQYTSTPGSDERPGSTAVILYDGPLIAAMVASDVRRYERCIPRVGNVSKTIIPAMTVKFPVHDMPVPQGWTTLVHPEGARYFVNQENRTFTEMNVCDEEICRDIEYYMQYLLDDLRQVVEDQDLELDMQQVDLVVEPKCEGDSVVGCYYFANHRDRCLFWLDDFDAQSILSSCKGVENLSHIRFAIQGEYWRHWDYFPSLCPVTQSLVDEMKYMLLHATCDHLTSSYSSAAFDAIGLREHLSVVDRIKIDLGANWNVQQCHTAVIIGRIMSSFCYNHFMNYHGEDCARLNNERTVFGWVYTPSLLISVLAPLLFFDPMPRVQEPNRIFVDGITHISRWDAFSSKFNEQLQNSNLLATVLLSANVGFLATNTVNKGGRSAIQIASYVSLVTSLGSIALGLVVVSRDLAAKRDTASEIAGFLSRFHDKKHGLEKLVIICSLPKALLMWGMIFFFTAFSINWWIPGDISSRTVVGTMMLIVFWMISYGIIRTSNGDRWGWAISWLRKDMHLKFLSRLAGTRGRAMELMGINRRQRDPTRKPRSDTEGVSLAPMGAPVGSPQANVEGDAPECSTSHLTNSPGLQPERPDPDDHENHPNSPISPRLHQPIAFVDSPLPLNDDSHDGIQTPD